MAKALLTVVLALTIAWHAHEQRRRAAADQDAADLAPAGIPRRIATSGAYSTGVVLPELRPCRSGRAPRVDRARAQARTYPVDELLRSWFSAITTVGLLAALTGLPSVASRRLHGGIPPAEPQRDRHALRARRRSGYWWQLLQGRGRGRDVALLALLLAFVWASGSRTSLTAVILAFVVMVVQARRLGQTSDDRRTGRGGVRHGHTSLLATDVLGAFFGRGGDREHHDVELSRGRSRGRLRSTTPTAAGSA